jgi:hypothetical protein
MTTRQNEVRRILQKLNGCAPDDSAVAQMANIAEAAEIAPGDALFPLMVALEYYRVTYEKVPESIKEASSFLLREHAEALNAESEKIKIGQIGHLEDATKKLLIVTTQFLQQQLPIILKAELEKAATLAVRDPVNAAASRFEQTTHAAENAIKQLKKAEGSTFKVWCMSLLFTATIGGMIGGCVSAWTAFHTHTADISKSEKEAIQWGAALQEVWAKLTPQSQRIIKDAVEHRNNKPE